MASNKKKNEKHEVKLKPLEISSATLFRCPISLEVMKSPVSLSTGVTYDRSSIQKWLDSGHRTCPATCQTLSSTDLVPNLTLRRLIRLCSEYEALPEQMADVAYEIETASTVEMICTEVSSLLDETDRERSECVVLYLASVDGEMKENAVSALAENPDASVSALIRVLQKGNAIESRIAACRLIESVLTSSFLDKDSKVQTIERTKLFDELVYSIGEFKNRNAVITAIECMLNLIESNDKKKLRAEMVRSGAIPTMVMLIKSVYTPTDVAGKAMRVLEQASRCKEGSGEILFDAKQIIEILTDRMMKVGREGREAAVGTIWAMCSKNGGGDDVREAVKKMTGIVGMLLMVMQEDCSPAIGLMAGDLLKVCVGERGRERKEGNYTKTMHIMPF